MNNTYFFRIIIIISLFFGIVTLTYGQTGNKYAISLDGPESFYVNDDGSNHLDLTGSYTYECWFNVDSYQKYDRIFDRRYVCAMSIIERNGTGDFALRFTERGSNHDVLRTLETAAAYDMDLDTWYHVAVTYDATSHDAKLYINGDLAASDNSSYWSLTGSSKGLNIGGMYNTSYQNQIDAHIDEVRVSNIARNIADMQTSYSSEKYSSDANTVLLMHLDDLGDSPTYISGTGLTGTRGDDDVSSADYTDARIGTPTFLLRPNYQSKATGNWGDASTWNYHKDGATWTAASYIPDEYTQEVYIQGGHSVTLAGTFTNNGTLTNSGTFINNGTYTDNGTTIFNGSSAQTIPIAEYNNLIIDNSSGVDIDGDIDVNSNLTIIDGTITIGATETLNCKSDVIIETNGTIANNGTLKIGDDLIINGSGTYSDAGTTYFTNEQHTHYIQATAFNNLILENYSSYTSYIENDITVAGNLEIKTGKLDMNAFDISLGTTGTLNENGGILIGGSNGTITATRTLNNPGSVNVGGLGAIITSSANLGATTVIRGQEYHVNANAGHSEQSIKRYYDITPATNTGLDATLRFSYFASELNSSTEADLLLYRSTNGTDWIKQDEDNTTQNPASNYVELTGIDAFSMWTASDGIDYPLPIELLSFTARNASNAIVLDWQTASEINNEGFELQRSIDGENWSNIAFISGAGNSNEILKYEFVDNKPNMINYYRLKQMDFDGAFEYSQMVYAELKSDNISIYPNPTNSTLNISGFDKSEIKKIALYNYMGKLISEIPVNTTKIDVSDLSSGYYFIQLKYINGSYVNKKFIKK